MDKITSFRGKYEFLSNFYMTPVEYEGVIYPSSEHAYVAAKTTDNKIRRQIAKMPSSGQVKKYGRKMVIRSDWDAIKLNVMRTIIENKFSNDRLYKMLVQTKPYEIIEGNNWGECPLGNGKNNLGKLLMEIRDENNIVRFFQ